MVRKEAFLEQIPLYIDVLEAFFNKEIELDLCDIRSIHHCLNIGLGYVKKENEVKIFKKYKLLLKEIIDREEGAFNTRKKPIKNLDIRVLHLQKLQMKNSEQTVLIP